ncbi:MAG: Nif3-like dinuclear metal center hexameric protein [Actinomycetota bacterium]|nr:Nif3-like dinuclear metal center hexameric protein [Actinomycetota bacterium]MDQ5807417.1 Nif3-like dinuclear metal center hexameric protein [Actinomycetota bacterium]
MLVTVLDLISDLDALLRARDFDDYSPNGLQVPGPEEVRTVATGVTASVALFERAAAEDAQLVLVHHGLFWKGMPQHVDRAMYRRLRPLFLNDIALAAYHLPLDAHPEVGNNALLARALGCDSLEPFAEHSGQPIGMAGTFGGDGISAEDLVARVREVTGRDPLHLAHGPARVRTIGVVSGGAASYLDDAIAAGHDAFLTGEPAERVLAQSREAGIHFLGAGHYATETFGVRALGDRLSERFGVRHVFLDDPNPI